MSTNVRNGKKRTFSLSCVWWLFPLCQVFGILCHSVQALQWYIPWRRTSPSWLLNHLVGYLKVFLAFLFCKVNCLWSYLHKLWIPAYIVFLSDSTRNRIHVARLNKWIKLSNHYHQLLSYCCNLLEQIYLIFIFVYILFLACLHDQNKSGFFGGPAFIQPIRAGPAFIQPIRAKSSDWLEKKPALQKSHFWFDHVNRLFMVLYNY